MTRSRGRSTERRRQAMRPVLCDLEDDLPELVRLIHPLVRIRRGDEREHPVHDGCEAPSKSASISANSPGVPMVLPGC